MPSDAKAAQSSRGVIDYRNLPLSFEPNRGQTSPAAQWLARGPEYTLYLSGADAVLQINKISPAKRDSVNAKERQPSISSSAMRMNLVDASVPRLTSGEDLQAGKANYFTGNDPAKWQHEVPMYGKVRMQAVYPGVDLVYYGHQGKLEYDFVVAPGADASAIKLRFDGAEPALAANGDLVLPVAGRGPEVRFHKPVVYQTVDGLRRPVDGSFAIAKNRHVSFELAAYDRSRELIIDPTFDFIGALGSGGGGYTEAYGMAVDAKGEIILTGVTTDATFPVTTGTLQTVCNTDAPADRGLPYTRCGTSQTSSGFVTKISADGTSLVYSTYLHGLSGNEYGGAVAADSLGDAYVLGATSSNDFPLMNPFQSVCEPYYPLENGVVYPSCDGFFNGGGTEYTVNAPTLFISELNPGGSALLYSTFFGGNQEVTPVGIVLDSLDNIYFAGWTQYALQANNFYLANPGTDNSQFPVTASAYQASGVGSPVATLSVLSAGGQSLIYSTFMGTALTSTSYVGTTVPQALAIGPNGMAYIAGYTNSYYFPRTPGVITPSCPVYDPSNLNYQMCHSWTGFLSAFDTTKSGDASLVYSTFIGPTIPVPVTGDTYVYGLAADSSNNAYVTGNTTSNNYPVTTGAFQPTCPENQNYPVGQGPCNTGFLSKINPTGTANVWSTFFGGTSSSSGYGVSIAFDAKERVYLYGYDTNYGYDLPLVNPLEGRPGNGSSYPYIATFSPDGTQLIFATPLGNTNPAAGNTYPIFNGMALDADGNMYFAAYGADGDTWNTTMVTPGTYATPYVGGYNRTFFGKISPLLDTTATTLTVTPSAAGGGQAVTFTATVAGTPATTPTPTGSVTLVNIGADPAVTLGTITLGANGSGSFKTSSLAEGSYSVTAAYSGDSNYEASTSSAQTLTIGPTITTQPLNTTVHLGSTATFSVTATGVPTLTYQWQYLSGSTWKAFGAGSGYTTATLTTFATTAAYDGLELRVVVTDGNSASTSSNAVKLRVAPTITTQPTSQTVADGSTATFTAAAAGVGTLTYEWEYLSGTTWKAFGAGTGYNTPTLTTFATTTAYNDLELRLVVTSANGTQEASSTVTLRVGPAITTQPVSQTVTTGSTATFSVTAEGVATLTYQWQYLSGTTWKAFGAGTGYRTATLTTFATTSAYNGLQLRVVVTDGKGLTAISNTVSLTVE